MKYISLALLSLAVSAPAFATHNRSARKPSSAFCSDEAKIQKAAEGAFKKSEKPSAGDFHFSWSKNGKDKFVVDVVVQEECDTNAVVYMKAGTCEVDSATEIGSRDCG